MKTINQLILIAVSWVLSLLITTPLAFATDYGRLIHDIDGTVGEVQKVQNDAERAYDRYSEKRNDAIDAQTDFHMKDQAHNNGTAEHKQAQGAAGVYNRSAERSNSARDHAIEQRQEFHQLKQEKTQSLEGLRGQLDSAEQTANQTIFSLEQDIARVNQQLEAERAKPKWDAKAKQNIRNLERRLQELQTQKTQTESERDAINRAKDHVHRALNDISEINIDEDPRHGMGFADPLPTDMKPTCNCKIEKDEDQEQETGFIPLPLPGKEVATSRGFLLPGSGRSEHEEGEQESSNEPAHSSETGSQARAQESTEAMPLAPAEHLPVGPQDGFDQVPNVYELGAKNYAQHTFDSFREPMPKEINFRKYGETTGFDPQRGVTFVTNRRTGEITYFYSRRDDQFADPQGSTQAVTMRNGKVVHTDHYDHLGNLMAPPGGKDGQDSLPKQTPTSAGGADDIGFEIDTSVTYHVSPQTSVGTGMAVSFSGDTLDDEVSDTDETLNGDVSTNPMFFKLSSGPPPGQTSAIPNGVNPFSEQTPPPNQSSSQGQTSTPTQVSAPVPGSTSILQPYTGPTPDQIPIAHQIRACEAWINFYQDALPNLEAMLKKREGEAERFNELWEEARRKGNLEKMDEYGRKAAEADVRAGNLRKEIAEYREGLAEQQEKLKTLQEGQAKSRSTKKKDAGLGSSFTSFEALQQGGLSTLNATPTATFDAIPQSRDMDSNRLMTEHKPEAGSHEAEYDY